MTTNDFLPIGVEGSPNVMPQSDYAASTNREQGWPTGGVPTAAEWNKMVRQSAVITSQFAQAVSDIIGGDMLDNGNVATILGNIKAAFQASSGALNYVVDSGAADAVVVTLAPAITANKTGLPIYVKMAHTNTGATTINVNGIGAATVVSGGAPLAANALIAGVIYTFMYDGANYQVESAGGGGGGGPSGALLAVNNLSDLNNVATAQTNMNVPTRTGGNASGTWGVDISGTAAHATQAASLVAANTYTAVDFIATSDERLKNIGEAINGVLDRLDGVRVFKYRWNSNAIRLGFRDEGWNIGLSAQEMQKVDPSLVTAVTHTKRVQKGTEKVQTGIDRDKKPIFEERPVFAVEELGTYLGVDANDMIALLVQGLKEAHARIKALEGTK